MHLVSIPRDGDVKLPGIALPDVLTGVIASTVQLYSRRGYVEPWVGYLAIDGDCCVGTCGFTSPPLANVVEIAYFTFPELENRGIATRMAASLLSLARQHDPSVKIIAHTLMEENASNHILKKLGFVFAGKIDHPEDGMIWKWEYKPQINPID